jgi:hypothetical protein
MPAGNSRRGPVAGERGCKGVLKTDVVTYKLHLRPPIITVRIDVRPADDL